MTRILPATVFAALLAAAAPAAATGQAVATGPAEPALKHSLEISPVSPFIRIYAFHYAYEFSPRNEVIVGPAFMNIRFDFGETRSPALILGYRRYLWRTLHVEWQLWPCYDWFREKNERKTYESFDLWNEARAGYRFDFQVKQANLYVNLQWAFGFGLYASNKPQSFKDAEKKSPYFTAPLVFFGARF